MLNFQRWLLTLVSIGNFILAPLIIYMGYQAQQYDYNDLLVVDKALIILGIWVLFISVLTIISKSTIYIQSIINIVIDRFI